MSTRDLTDGAESAVNFTDALTMRSNCCNFMIDCNVEWELKIVTILSFIVLFTIVYAFISIPFCVFT